MSSLMDPAAGFGALMIAIVGGLLVALVLYVWDRGRRGLWRAIRVIARPLTRPMTSALKRAMRRAAARARSSPGPIKNLIMRAMDRWIPSWRTFIEWETGRTRRGTHKRLIDLKRSRKELPCVLLGSTYLDVTLRPIHITELARAEHGGLEPVEVDCGGSTVWVGRHLYDRYERKSYLLTRIGRGDPFSRLLERRLLKEKWIKKRKLKHSRSERREQCGISIHLTQYERPFHTTFTSAGTLRNLGWGPNLGRVQRLTPLGGVLYVSGYFRTNLLEMLEKSLRQISTRVLVVVDHGQFTPHGNPPAEDALAAAFRGGLVDMYVCTFEELRAFAVVACPDVAQDLDPADFIIQMALSDSLPMVTVVRGDFPTPSADTYLLRNRDVTPFDLRQDLGNPENQPGERSRFTAGLLQKLLEPSQTAVPNGLTVEEEERLVCDILGQAINEAIKCWQQEPLTKDMTVAIA